MPLVVPGEFERNLGVADYEECGRGTGGCEGKLANFIGGTDLLPNKQMTVMSFPPGDPDCES